MDPLTKTTALINIKILAKWSSVSGRSMFEYSDKSDSLRADHSNGQHFRNPFDTFNNSASE